LGSWQFFQRPQETNVCRSEIEKIIRNSVYIPATVEANLPPQQLEKSFIITNMNLAIKCA